MHGDQYMEGCEVMPRGEPKVLDGVLHGKRNAYNMGCRCASCREANRVGKAIGDAIRRQKEPPQHGTDNSYTNYGCRCRQCVAAGKMTNRRLHENRLRRCSPPKHGTPSAYHNHGCRCSLCRESASEYHRARYQASKERK